MPASVRTLLDDAYRRLADALLSHVLEAEMDRSNSEEKGLRHVHVFVAGAFPHLRASPPPFSSDDGASALTSPGVRAGGHVAINAENCHSFFTQVSRYKTAGLEQYTALAKEQYEEHLGLYVRAVLKKALGRSHVSGRPTLARRRGPLGRWAPLTRTRAAAGCRWLTGSQDFFDGIDTLLKTRREDEVAFNLSFNKATLKKVVRESSSKEVCSARPNA